MRNTRQKLLILALCGFTLAASAGAPGSSVGPYSAIASRNTFGLISPPPLPRQEIVKPLPRISLVGITTILGGKRAVLKVQPPESPSRESFFILTEGQRAGGLEVLEIDEVAARVTVRNAGALEVLTFAAPAQGRGA